MSEWKAKRFWKAAGTAPEGAGFTVLLDGRPVRTPAKAPLVLPTLALAREIAAEWDAQEGQIDPATMPLTRAANAAIDKVGPQQPEVAGLIAAYGDADLLCYRAESPAELVARQAATWDTYLAWAAATHGIVLTPVCGVVHVPQPAESLRIIGDLTAAMTAFGLTAFHDLVSLSGSYVLGLAAISGGYEPARLWADSRLDEAWQQEQWGADDDATQAAEIKAQAFLSAARFHDLCINQA